MKKIKVVHILDSVGGVDVSLRFILSNVDSSKFENLVIRGIDQNFEPFRDDNRKEIEDFVTDIYREINIIKDIKSLIFAYKKIKQLQPNLIHAHSTKGGVIGKIVGSILNIPVLHTPQAFSYLSSRGIKRSLFLLMERSIMRFGSSKILASSNSEKNRAINDIGYQDYRVLVFKNSIDSINTFKQLTIEKTWPDEYICSVGRPSYQKNIEFMLVILGHVRDLGYKIHLVLMGIGFYSPNLNSINRMIKRLNLEEQITLLSWTDRDNILKIIKDSKFYISTARYEGLPYSVIESLALGKPIIATDVDGNRDLVIDNYNGYLLEEKDLEGFSKRIIELLKDENKIRKFSINSKKFFEKEFTISKNINLLEKIYMLNAK